MSRLSDKRSPFEAPNFDVFAPARLQDPRGIIEADVRLEDARLAYTPWIGLSTVRELALKHSVRTELVDEVLLEAAQDRVAELEHAVEHLTTLVQEQGAYLDNIAGLARAEFQVNKRKGPQTKPQEVGV